MIVEVIRLPQMLRDFQLSLEVHDYVIFYHWNYSPAVKNVGGSFGHIYSDGALFGLSFNELKLLGNGTHDIQLDEHNRTPNGTKPDFDGDQKQLELFKTVAFGYHHGVFTKTDLLMYALLSFTHAHSETVQNIAPDFLIQSLVEYASRVPEIIAVRSPDSFDFFSNTGATRIPEKNLQLLMQKLAPKNAG